MNENINKNDELKDEEQVFFIKPKKENIESEWQEINNVENNNNATNLEQKTVQNEPLINTNDNQAIITETKNDIIQKEKDANSLESILANVWNEFPQQKKEKFSININSFDDLLKIILNNEYDYVIVSPEYEKVKLIFKKEEKEIEEKFVIYPIYSNILIKLKSLVSLDSDRKKPQEWKWRYKFDKKEYDIEVATTPESFGEKITIKPKLRIKNRASASEVLTFIWALSFIIFIISSSFITFIVMNAQNVEDVIFFNSLWISLNDINDFIWKVVNLVFSSVIFIEIILFAVFWIKFLMTKKEFKKKKAIFWWLAFLFLMLTFVSWNLWIATIKKVKNLPNWEEMSYWDIQLYDNAKLLFDNFYEPKDALLSENEYWNLIWPVSIKFDLTYYAKKEEKNWQKIEKFIWDFWDGEIREELTPIIIKEFKEKKTYNIKVSIELRQLDGKKVTKVVDKMPLVWIKNVVTINEELTDSWWKKVSFDASDLRSLGKIELYTENNLDEPNLVWDRFTYPKIIFADTIVWLYIKKEWKKSLLLDKIFFISWLTETKINWIIQETKMDDDLEYEFKIKNFKRWVNDWFVEEYKWIIWDREKILKNEEWAEEQSSKITHIFSDFWTKTIVLLMTDSYGKVKKLTKTIEVTKSTELKSNLTISNDWIEIKPRNEHNIYYIQDLLIPTTLKFDARNIKTNNPNDLLQKTVWEDGKKTKISNTFDFKMEYEWKATIKVKYSFNNIKDWTTKEINETIYINSIKKDVLLDLEIKPSEEEYAPAIIQFDASRSEVKDENITKFTFDYWDWTPPEEKDSVNKWHKYNIPWNYTIKLTVTTSSWKEYYITKKLILKPRPQLVNIKTSLKEAPVYQWIDFSSSDSEWQIIAYFWDFWDWETSTDANPTHSYKESWVYTAKLKIEFENKNVLEDKVIIKITD